MDLSGITLLSAYIPLILFYLISDFTINLAESTNVYSVPRLNTSAQHYHDTYATDDDWSYVPMPDKSGNLNSFYNGKRVVGYFTAWGNRNFTIEQAKHLTHAIFAFLKVHPDGTIGLDSNKENFDRLPANASPTMASDAATGGWENSEHFSSIIADSNGKRQTFIESIVEIVKDYGFDGVDLDWEYPVTGGANEGVEVDKPNYVDFLRELRSRFTALEAETQRHSPLIISFAGAAGQWTLDPGFDLPGLLKYADYVNIMTYDYFGAWPTSKWGAYTGPPAPLWHGTPKSYSGKTHVHWSLKYYYCRGGKENLHKLTMGLPFYGRFWKNVGNAVDPADPMWRLATPNRYKEFEGGHVAWSEMAEKNWNPKDAVFHEKTKSAYIWKEAERMFLGMENEETLKHKLAYFNSYNLGGVMIWSLDMDDDYNTLLNAVVNGMTQSGSPVSKVTEYVCPPISERRWWIFEDGPDLAGKCGPSAPLFKGHMPVCDPDDPGYSCCGPYGYCGSGPQYCDCATCVNYALEPWKIVEGNAAQRPNVQWYTALDPEHLRGRCGSQVPPINGKVAICQPDSPNAYCCSNAGYCGNTVMHCQCPGCVDYRTLGETLEKTVTPISVNGWSRVTQVPAVFTTTQKSLAEVEWWTYDVSPENRGRCGPTAPRLPNGKIPKCNWHTDEAPCCSRSGWCGSTESHCKCQGCVDFRSASDFEYANRMI
ncbi:glycosyl hydrolases family 18 domain-containing protein [Ditylenchus destructor]|nr:glycosyl hydrolases family 18 domain-containing protein [Ditylenchus destructor]